MEINECKIVFSENYRLLTNKNKVIIGNILNGLWLKCSDYIYAYLFESIKNEKTISEIIEGCLDEDTSRYMRRLIDALIKMNIIISRADSMYDNMVKHLTIELTTKCNLRCVHCCADCGEVIRTDLDMKKVQDIIEWSQENKVESISLTGGEIFMRKDIWDILEFVRRNFNGTVEILTNGTLINSHMITRLISLVDCISISLDGYDEESVSKIRGKGVYNLVLRNIESFKKKGFNKISLSMVITKETIDGIATFHNLCSTLGVRPVTRVFTPEGRGEDNYNLLNPSFNNFNSKEIAGKSISKLQDSINFKSICSMESKIFICADEKIFSCFLEVKSGNLLGDIDNLLGHALNKPFVLPIVDSIEPCATCNVRYFCGSACPGHNTAVFKNERYREELCQSSYEYMNKIAWS